MQEYAPFVVRLVAVAAADPLDGLDHPVVALGPGVGDPQLQERQDLGPPGLDRGREAGQFGNVGVGGALVEPLQAGADLIGSDAAVDAVEELAQAFLAGPGGEDLSGRIIGCEQRLQPGPPPVARVFSVKRGERVATRLPA